MCPVDPENSWHHKQGLVIRDFDPGKGKSIPRVLIGRSNTCYLALFILYIYCEVY